MLCDDIVRPFGVAALIHPARETRAHIRFPRGPATAATFHILRILSSRIRLGARARFQRSTRPLFRRQTRVCATEGGPDLERHPLIFMTYMPYTTPDLYISREAPEAVSIMCLGKKLMRSRTVQYRDQSCVGQSVQFESFEIVHACVCGVFAHS
jgi:hypothetical protein